MTWRTSNHRKSAAAICGRYAAKIQSQRYTCASCCSRRGCVTGKTFRSFLALPTCISQSTGLLFLFMDVSGIDTKGAKYAYMPKSRTEFWVEKFDVNVSRDRLVHEQLSRMGIRYLIVWECTINAMVKSTIFREDQLREILAFLEGTEESMEL